MSEQLELENPPPSGRSNARGGRDAEIDLEHLHEQHFTAGIAYLHKVPTPYSTLGMDKTGALRIQHKAKPGTDFRGVLLDGTKRSVWVECKRESDLNGRFALSEVREKQVEQLDVAERSQNVAVLCVYFGPRLVSQLFAVPWWWTKTMGKRSFRAADVAEFRVRTGELYLARWARKAGAK